MKNCFTVVTAFLFISHVHTQLHFEKNLKFDENNYHTRQTDKSQPMYNSLSDAYDVKFYGIDLEADNTSIYLNGSVTIGATVVAAELDTFVVELHPDYTIDSIKVNGIHESFARDYDDVIVLLSSAIPQSEWIEAQIFYHGGINKNGWSGIMHDESYEITYTLTEPLYAKDWFPCKQVLTDKADSVFVFITTEESLKVGSNGLLTEVVPAGGGKVRHEWKTFYPTAFYLISFAVGNYFEYNIYAKPEGTDDSVLIQNYLYSEAVLNNYKDEIDITTDLIEIFSELFGMYPFKNEKYGHCMAPIGGGMEHQTMTTISGFDFMLVSHELTHMWFGDFVTCGAWMDIWINEGFATYGHLLALKQLNGEFPIYEMAGYHDDQIGYVLDGSIYIPESRFNIDYSREIEVDALTWRIFDWYLSYEKGAIILHMLRYELDDDEMFFTILRTFLSQYQFSNALGDDFKTVVEDISGKDFTDFFNQWYYGEGYPVYDIQWFQQNDTVYIRSVQTTSASSTPLFKMNMDYRLIYSGNESIVRLYQAENEQIHRIYFPEPVTRISIDPLSWTLKNIRTLEKEEFPLVTASPLTGAEKIGIYPNPVMDILYFKVNCDDPSAIITLYDLSGHVIKKIFTGEFLTEMNLTLLDKGIYIVEIRTASEQIIRKIIKQ